METNLKTSNDAALNAAAQTLLDAAMAYWGEYKRATGGAAVVWLKGTDGALVVFTRGEYRETLMRNIDSLERNADTELPGLWERADFIGGETDA